MSVTMNVKQRHGNDLDINPMQLEAVTSIDMTVAGRYSIFGVNPDDDSKFAIGTEDFNLAAKTGHARPFRVNENGRIILMQGDKDMPPQDPDVPDVDPLHFAILVLSYPSLVPGSAHEQNEAFLEAAHNILHAGDFLTLPFGIPLEITIGAVRLCAQEYGLLPK